MRILGLDPGYGLTGWGIVEKGRTFNSFVSTEYGVVATPVGAPIPERLEQLYEAVRGLLADHRPARVVVEQLFVNRNLKTAGDVYQARGVLLLAAQQAGCPILTFNPARIKLMLTGNGRAGKKEVMLMVRRLLGIREAIRPDDAADALAGALCGQFAVRAESTLGASAFS